MTGKLLRFAPEYRWSACFSEVCFCSSQRPPSSPSTFAPNLDAVQAVLRWLWRPWLTKISFQALHNSHVDFSRSRDASNSEDCSIRCARRRAFQKAFDHQIWAFGSKVIKILLLSICIVTHFSDFDGRIRVNSRSVHSGVQLACYLNMQLWQISIFSLLLLRIASSLCQLVARFVSTMDAYKPLSPSRHAVCSPLFDSTYR